MQSCANRCEQREADPNNAIVQMRAMHGNMGMDVRASAEGHSYPEERKTVEVKLEDARGCMVEALDVSPQFSPDEKGSGESCMGKDRMKHRTDRMRTRTLAVRKCSPDLGT